MQPLTEANLTCLPLLHKGKVRDIYEIDDKHMLIVTTDRLSAFDVILPTPIPQKGATLNAISNFWFHQLAHIVPNHLSDMTLEQAIPDTAERERVKNHAIVVKRLKPVPIEAIVRGYLIGSGWKEYQAAGSVCGITLPSGLQLADQLPEAIFTPSTKADIGQHDENIDFSRMCDIIGDDLAEQVRRTSLQLYSEAATFALAKGIIIADTKFEFGLDADGTLTLMDEVLTPDSSRFWPVSEYQPGISPPSFDKQIVRDWLESQPWNKQAPGPVLPDAIKTKASEKYREALTKLTH
ncbi:MAG: phosphoribosylaminoimidazolesuccinocarboxamide synthase [Zetaproteobacteria bacterium CG_4_9_14_3_um_filter_49_83]|nr:MAG: phosphoribosylaminoimidazolesuccinocarboxamide synthase [Zetaproteobacteria bacterium CG1_02_49_23]PIQ31284.1 MAG: phosphoribosylaminoimidazolesuccinocarboxamide synthase [Zetaproteobacteria bacterium CG17_big_fil_post_rev_8_21_14_2_50_50_13]PIV30589.1 MAG: phosphoribosylaminoimidazolesuccinocarboxamide synthase [Zetaproteobacteria bacterium CG02_land_8_20_14_3_00_50_9]PIY55602.1 MAG: phosphoribosylaminoimidazolesuccinocarboxamide synthase [Zetaproteobacteria bacterium CG_4_10_14_0_8_um_